MQRQSEAVACNRLFSLKSLLDESFSTPVESLRHLFWNTLGEPSLMLPLEPPAEHAFNIPVSVSIILLRLENSGLDAR